MSAPAEEAGPGPGLSRPQPTANEEVIVGFNADAAHQQLLQALHDIDRKLDGLAEELRSSCLAGPRTTEWRKSTTGQDPSDREHRVVSFQSRRSQRSQRLSHFSHGSFSSGTHEHRGSLDPRFSNCSAALRSGSVAEWANGTGSESPVMKTLPSGGCLVDSTGARIRPGYGRAKQIGRSQTFTSRWESFFTKSRVRQSVGEDPTASGSFQMRRAWNPDSTSRVMFDVLSMVLLIYEAFITPYRMAWNLFEASTGVMVVRWGTRIFWTLDLLLNFVTGYHDKVAKVELKIRKTVRKYLTTWFLIDLICVICDWLLAFYQHERWIRWIGLARLVRGIRHIPRLKTLVFGAKLMIQTTGLHLVMDIAQLVLVIVWANHLVCCVWFGIGQYSDSDTGITWLSGLESSGAGPYYDYLTAMHWAMAQMTPGSMEVMPRNSLERLFNLCVLLLGLLMGGSLVATLTSRMTQYQLRIDASSRKFMILRRFLHQQNIDRQHAMAIMMQVKTRTNEKQRIKAKDVEYLSLLPNALQDALWHAWCTQQISVHAFLVALNRFDSSAMLSLCKGAIVGQDVAAGDYLFDEGALGDHMYFVVAGRLRYIPGDLAPENHFREADARLTLKGGDWCSEPVLWTIWHYLGTLEAISTTEVLSVSATNLAATLSRFPDAADILADYCCTYHMYINEPGVLKSDLSYVFDLNEVLSRLGSDTRMRLAVPVIQKLESRFWVDHARIERLKAEIADGKCDIGLVGNEVVRNVFVVALKVYEQTPGYLGSTARFLAKIGEVERHNGKAVVVGSCLLPGVKRKAKETYSRAVERVLETDLSEIAQHVETHFTEGSTQTVSLQVSRTYGIRTRYLRASFHATLSASARPNYVNAPASPGDFGGHYRAASRMHWLFRNEFWQVAADQEHAAEVLLQQDRIVVLHSEKESRAFYLWINDHEFEVLSKVSAKPIIEGWLKALGPEQLVQPWPMQERIPEPEIDFPVPSENIVMGL